MDSASPPAPGGRRLWLAAMALWLALAAITGAALWQFRRVSVEIQSRELDLLAHALTGELDRGLRGAEAGLSALRDELRAGVLPLTDAGATQALRTRAAFMPLVDILWLVDRDGRALAASDPVPPPPLALFAPAPAALSVDAMALSRPFAGGGPGEEMVALAMRSDSAPAGHDGWIVAAVSTKALLGAMGRGMSMNDTSMTVYRGDGVRLASVNAPPPTMDEASLAVLLARRSAVGPREVGPGDTRIQGVYGLAQDDIQVVVSRDMAAVLQPWRQTAEGAALALALLLAVVALAVHRVQVADSRGAEAQRALQAQMSRAGKLESLGTLAGGIAHDFNNVLAGIVGFGEMARDAADEGSAQQRHLDRVLQAAVRGKALVERILAFSRGGARASTVFELAPVVEEVLGLMSASLRPGIVLERSLEAPGARVKGDATQSFEAVMNLCTNAMQSMPGGGKLTVRLTRQRIERPRVLSHTRVEAGDHLALTVADEGGGIAPQVMERLFEPFFTTRAAQSGTGLGLAVVFGVMAEFGGAIDVQSTPGQGARFTLYFPESAQAAAPARPPALGVSGGAGQRLLVVDDEPELVTLMVEMLRGLGYAPQGFGEPAAALEALRNDPEGFAAVITDELMPGLTGTQLTQALRSFAPDLPVLLVSGWGGALLAQRAASVGVTRVLAKPLQRDSLAHALAEVLRVP